MVKVFDGADDRWRDQAACAGMDPGMFVPANESPRSTKEALSVCATCPVIDECRAWAIGFDIFPLLGVFGGMTTVERELARRDAEAGRTPLLEAS